MKANDVPIWRILAHIIGFHFWSKPKAIRQWEYGPNVPPVVVKICEICGTERVIHRTR